MVSFSSSASMSDKPPLQSIWRGEGDRRPKGGRRFFIITPTASRRWTYGCHSPLAPRGYSYAPRTEQASLMTEIHSKCPASATALRELARRGETLERQRSR